MISREQIIAWARAACDPDTVDPWHNGFWTVTQEELERFAALIEQAAIERCAKVCDEKVNAEYATGKVDHNEMGWTQACAIAIRALKEKQA